MSRSVSGWSVNSEAVSQGWSSHSLSVRGFHSHAQDTAGAGGGGAPGGGASRRLVTTV